MILPDLKDGPLPGPVRDAAATLFMEIALEAAPAVLDAYENGCRMRTKPDASPVTEADERAEAIILAALARHLPNIPVVAEESVAAHGAPACGARFILVDPVDGTREFVDRSGEFTINIALVEDGVPVAGAVFAPVSGEGWTGGANAATILAPAANGFQITRRTPIRTRRAPATGLAAFASRSHGTPQTEAMLERLHVTQCLRAGSSVKFCRIAQGQGDVYPRLGPTMEWDTAAGDAVLRAAGGIVLDLDGAPLVYGKARQGYRNPDFLAWGDPAAGAAFAARARAARHP